MYIKDFNQLSLDDKIYLVNNTGSKLIESHSWFGKYDTNLYDVDGIKVNVLFDKNTKHVMIARALEDAELKALTDSYHLN